MDKAKSLIQDFDSQISWPFFFFFFFALVWTKFFFYSMTKNILFG